ncbi:MAG: DUF5666 domain-containing protein [Chloroflexota bacterium]
MQVRHKLSLIIVALVATLSLTASAWAATPANHWGLLRGEVTVISGASMTLQTPTTEITLLTDDRTVFDVPGVANATLNDLHSGDFVIVRAVRDSEGQPLARRVAVIPNGSLEDQLLKGIVAQVEGDTLRLRTGHGQVTVTTDASTVLFIPGVEEPSMTDLTVRMPLIALGQWTNASTETFHASALAVVPERIIEAHSVKGELSAVEDTVLLLSVENDEGQTQEVRVQTTDQTTFRVAGIENATIDDLNTGDTILAAGHWADDGDFVAKKVAVLPVKRSRVAMHGRVTAVGQDSLTLDTLYHGEVTLLITEQTRFRILGDPDPGLEDMAVGDQAGAIARQDEHGNLVASVVARLPKKLRDHSVRGQVTAIEGTTLLLETADGPVTVETDAATRYRIPGDDDPSLDDLTIGDTLIAAGHWLEDGIMQALVIGKVRPRA